MKLLVGINKITIDEKSKLNAGEYNVHEVEFEFDEVYNGLITKAVFEGNGHSYLIDIVNNKCTIPYEVLSEKGDITIGAYGYNIDGNNLVLRYSPSPIYTYVDLGSYRDSYDNYQQPTADIIEQLTNRIETAESQINEALEEVEGYNDRITTNTNNIDDLDNNKVDKIEGKGLSSNDYTNEEKTKLEGIETNAEVNIIEDIKVNDTSQSINNKSVNINIPTKTSDITNDSGFIDNSVNNLMNYTKSSDLATVATSGSYNDLSNKPTIPDVSSFITKDVNNLTNYTLKTNTGSLIDLEINNTTYVVTLSLKDIDGNVISTDTVDLPLENVVVSGRYDNNTKKVILTLENGSEVDFSVADLVAGLQTEITSTNKLASDLVDDSNSGNKFTNTSEKATWNAKYDKPISGIPKSDLTNDVQSSLNLADSALQSFTETDPIFSNSASAGITSNDISKWNNKQDTLIAGTNITIDNDGKTISATDTTYNDATTSASGLMSASDKTKLNGIETEANKTIVDDDFSDSSTNPLQNKVITDFIGTNATVTGTGTEFNLSNCLNKKLKSFKGYGDTKQDSLSGKNAATTMGAATSDYVNHYIDNTMLANEMTYSFIPNFTLNNVEVYIRNNTIYSKGRVNLVTNQKASITFTLTNEEIAVLQSANSLIQLYKADAGLSNPQLEEVQLEEGPTATSYEPYCGGIPAPNPDYPIPYYGVTGRQVVKFNSKNLLEIIDGTASLNGMSLTRKNGVMIFDGTNTNQYQGQYISMNLTLTEKMTFSLNNESSINNAIKFFCSYIPNGKSTTSYINVNGGKTFEVGDFIKQFYIIIDANTTVENYILMPQLESGSISTSAVPYKQEEYELNLDNITIYENEYIYNKDDEWMIKRNFGESLIKQVILASNNASKETLYQVDFGNFSNMKIQNWGKGYCNYFIANTTKSDGTIRFGANDNKIYAYTNNSNFSSTANANTWLSNNNLKVLYPLTEPYEEKITNEELINQLNAIQPILGDNIITVNSNNELLMSVDIEAYTNTQKGINQYLLDNI